MNTTHILARQMDEIVVGLVTAAITFFLSMLWANRKRLNLLILSKIKYRNKRIRMSMGYLFRIKVGNKYLLTHDTLNDVYRPIGGAYKYFDTFEDIREKYGVYDDDHVESDEDETYDLKITVKGKHSLNILEWFDSREDREVSVYREYHEELVEKKIVMHTLALEFNPEYLETVMTELDLNKRIKMEELMIYEIFEVELKEEDILTLKAYSGNDIVLVSAQDIERKNASLNEKPVNLSHNSQYII